jgi:EAL domain
LPIDEIKIDRSFVTDLATDSSDRAIVRSNIGLSHDLGLSVVAEGVETRAVLDALQVLGCDRVQGDTSRSLWARRTFVPGSRGRPTSAAPEPPSLATPRTRSASSRDDRVDVGKLRAEQPRVPDDGTVLDQERGPLGDVVHPAPLGRHAEGSHDLAVPVGEQRDIHAERLRPRGVRPDGIARDRERADAGAGEISAPVPQEQYLVGSGGRPVPEIEGEERQAGAKYVA